LEKKKGQKLEEMLQRESLDRKRPHPFCQGGRKRSRVTGRHPVSISVEHGKRKSKRIDRRFIRTGRESSYLGTKEEVSEVLAERLDSIPNPERRRVNRNSKGD